MHKKKKKITPKLYNGKELKYANSGKNSVKYIDEYPLALLYTKFKNHKRLKVFAKKGVKCVCCHNEGIKIFNRIAQYGNGKFSEHLDLYTKDLVLMTVDHKIPKYLKGSEDLKNKQPMCSVCNSNKGHKYMPFFGRFSWFYRLQYLMKIFLQENPKVKSKVDSLANFIKRISRFNSLFENAYSVQKIISGSQEPDYVEIKVRSSTKKKKKKKRINKKAIFVDCY